MLKKISEKLKAISDSHPLMLKVAKFNVALSSATLAGKVLTFLVMIPVARILGPAVYGAYSALVSYAGILLSFLNVGYKEVLAIETSRDQRLLPEYLSKTFTLTAYLSATLFAASTLAVIFYHEALFRVPAEIASNFSLLAVLYSACVLYFGPSNVFTRVFQVKQKEYHNAFSVLLERVVFAVGVVVLFYGNAVGGIKALVLAYLLSTLVVSVYWAYWALKWTKMKLEHYPDLGFAKRLFPKAKWFAASAIIAGVMGQISTFLTQSLSSTTQAGYFFTAYGLVVVALLMVTNAYWTTTVVAAKKTTRKFFYALAKRLALPVALAVAASLAATPVSGQLILALYKSDFLPAAGILNVLVFLLPLSLISLWGDQILISTGNQKRQVHILMLALSVNLVASILLIPARGALGAAAAMLLSQAVATAATTIAGYSIYSKMKPGTVYR